MWYVNGITLRQGLGQDRMSCYIAGFVEVLWELAGSKNGLKKWYLQAHLSILEYTCICILEQGSLWTRIAYVFFWCGRAWYPFSHGHDIIGRLQRHVWRTQNYCAKLSDATFLWNEDLGMRPNSTKVVWYSIVIPPTHSQTICVIVCRQSTYSFDTVYINTNQIRTTQSFQTF